MFLSIVSHWPFECQRTSDTSRNLAEGGISQSVDNNAGKDVEQKGENTSVSEAYHPV